MPRSPKPIASSTALVFALLAPLAAPRAQEPVLRGLDPVALIAGREVPGKPEFEVQRGGDLYRFASAESRDTFAAAPERHEIQLGGACARMGPLSGLGDPHRFLVHDARIYVFASDQCRDGFRKRPADFLAIEEPAPTDAAALALGKLLIERAAAAHGGRARLLAWRSYRHERAVENGDMVEQRRLLVQLPATARVDTDFVQGDKTWRNGRVVSPAANFALSSGKVLDLGPDAVRETHHDLGREPLLALRAVLDGRAVAVPAGKHQVAGIAVEEVTVWADGRTVVFGLGDDGRVRTARCRGRGPNLWFGALELVFDDVQERAGLRVPTVVRARFDGAEAPALHERRDVVEVDVELPASAFARPEPKTTPPPAGN
jgi:YHS domain-containing protein